MLPSLFNKMSLKNIEGMLDKKYSYPQPTAKDVQKAINFYPDLRPAMDKYVFPDGTTKDLMNLAGTIPVVYKGQTYNIPVEIWIMDTHPYNPPLCYVRPTPDMAIKQNRQVDQNGRVYLPYLTEWNHTKSELLECIQIMAIQFGESCPVYSKKSVKNQPVTQPYGTPGGYPAMPMPMPTPTGPASNVGYPPYPPAGAYPIPPGYPAYPSQPYVPPRTQPDPAMAYPYNPPRNSYPAYNPPTNNGPAYPSPVPPYGQFVPADNSGSNTNTISEEHIKVSLLSAVEEKLGRRLNEVVTQAQAEITSLTRTHDELEKGRKTLDDIFQKLDAEQRIVDRNIVLLTEKISELHGVLDKVTESDTLDVDEAIVPAAPLYKQLLNAYAEESAIEDAIYYVGEALRRSAIDLDVFLKHMRDLSRKQFMQRALIQKCRDKAGLP